MINITSNTDSDNVVRVRITYKLSETIIKVSYYATADKNDSPIPDKCVT